MINKVDVHVMYKLYKTSLHSSIEKYKKLNVEVTQDIDNLLDIIKRKIESSNKGRNRDKVLDLIKDKKYYKLEETIKNSLLVDGHISKKIIELIRNKRKYVGSIKALTKYYGVNEELYCYIIRQFNLEVSKYILGDGYIHNIGFRLGYLGIQEKKRVVINDRTAINWNESLKELRCIAKEVAPHILQQYKDKVINKYSFVEQMKEFVYNKDNNPTGRKWIIFHDEEYSYWWYWNKAQCNIKHQSLYSFVPTNFIHNASRSQIDFTNKAKDKREILDSTLLGMRDKLQALLRFDSNHYLTYRDVQESK